MQTGDPSRWLSRQRAGLFAGPLVLLIMLLLPPPQGMSLAAWRTAAVGLFMAIWWITEAVHISATALIPLVLLPFLGVVSMADSSAPYADPVIFLFMGGFIIAAALERCGLHRRLALSIIRLVGTRPANLVAGFMAATAFMSMWVSNTATVVMMLPMALSVLELSENGTASEESPCPDLGVAMLLGIAYAASIGGIGTLIGTPPNALLAGFMSKTYKVEIGFAQWMLVGVPLVVVSLPLCWLLLVRVLFPMRSDNIAGGREMIAREIAALGRLGRAEITVGLITAIVAASWIFRPLLSGLIPGLSDTGIAMTGAILLFLIPVNWRRLEFALDWHHAERLPWAVLVLVGGGLSLANAIQKTGLAEWIGDIMGGLKSLPILLVTVVVTTVIIFLTELTSNTATAAAFLPVVASLATGMGADPLMLAIPTALGASCAFMLPVATPPNAIVYSSGRLSVPQMARAGIWLNILFIVLINIAAFTLAAKVFGTAP